MTEAMQEAVEAEIKARHDFYIEDVRKAVRPYLVPGRPEWDRAEAWLAEFAGHLIHKALFGSDNKFACGTDASDEAIEQVHRITARLYCSAIITVAEEYGFTGDAVRATTSAHGLGDVETSAI